MPPLRLRLGCSRSELEALRSASAASFSSRWSFLSSNSASVAGLPLLMRPYALRAAPYAVSREPRSSSSSSRRCRYRLRCAARAASPALLILSFAAITEPRLCRSFAGSGANIPRMVISDSGRSRLASEPPGGHARLAPDAHVPGDSHGARAAADARGTRLGAGAPLDALAGGAVRARRIRARQRRPRLDRLPRALELRRGSGVCGADRDPVPRRPRGRGRDAPACVASATAQARPCDAIDDADRDGSGAPVDRALLDGVVPARGAARADRPGADVEHRHQPARAAPGATFAEPRVGTERRTRAAGRARVPSGVERRLGALRVVEVRAARRRPRSALRPRLRLARLAPHAARHGRTAVAVDP